MGAGQSIQSATDAQKERYGIFQLRKTQSHSVEALTDLLEQLVSTNILLDLKAISETPETCDSLFILSSSSHKEEFQDMRFPDPSDPSSPRIVSFIPKNAYEARAKNTRSPRKIMCGQIGFFVVRLITLVAALLASVKIHPTMTGALFSSKQPVSPGINERYYDPVLPEEPRPMAGGSLSASAVDSLKKGGAFHRARAGNQEDVRALYFFGTKDSVIVDAARELVYAPQLPETGVLRIRIEPMVETMLDPRATRTNRNYRPEYRPDYRPDYRPEYRPESRPEYRPESRPEYRPESRPEYRPEYRPDSRQPDYRQGPFNRESVSTRADSNTGTNLMGIRGGSRIRQTRRRGPRRRGGAARPRYVVTLYQFLNCKSDGCVEVDKFFMDDEGNTFGYAEFMKSKRDLSIVVTSSEFHTRVGSILSKPRIAGSVKNRPPSKEVRDRTLRRDSFAPLGKLDPDVYKRIVTVKDVLLSGKPEGYSPASYRAFLLASQLESELATGEKGSLNSLFCSDAWQDRDTTTTVAYSLLQSLYKDLATGAITSRSAKECEVSVQKYMPLARIKTIGSMLPARYDELSFRTTPEPLKPICSSQAGDGPRPLYSESHKRILMDAHQALRDLYDRHLEACIELLRPILFFGSRGGYASPPSIRLDEEFRKHPRGSQVALEEKIADARALLSEHYFQVESIYQTALESLGNLTIGDFATSEVKKDKKVDRFNEIAKKLGENEEDEEDEEDYEDDEKDKGKPTRNEVSIDTTSATWMKGKVNQGTLSLPADTTNSIEYSPIKNGDTIVKVNSRLNDALQPPSYFSLDNWIAFLDSRLPQPVYNPNYGTQTVVVRSDVTIHTARITPK